MKDKTDAFRLVENTYRERKRQMDMDYDTLLETAKMYSASTGRFVAIPARPQMWVVGDPLPSGRTPL